MIANVRSTILGASPRDGSSNMIRRGRDISARPIASICCSPPDKRTRRLLSPLGKARKLGIDPIAVRGDLRASGAQIGAHVEVLLDRHVRKYPPSFRTMRDARGHHARRFGACDILALEQHRSRTRRDQPGDRTQRRALAGAVGADQGDELPGLDLQRNAAQRGDAAIAAHHVADLKHVPPPARDRPR